MSKKLLYPQKNLLLTDLYKIFEDTVYEQKCRSWNSTIDTRPQNSNFPIVHGLSPENSFFQSTVYWKTIDELSSNSNNLHSMSVKIRGKKFISLAFIVSER